MKRIKQGIKFKYLDPDLYTVGTIDEKLKSKALIKSIFAKKNYKCAG